MPALTEDGESSEPSDEDTDLDRFICDVEQPNDDDNEDEDDDDDDEDDDDDVTDAVADLSCVY